MIINYKIRCNNCMSIFESDIDLELIDNSFNIDSNESNITHDREFIKVCTDCKTDAYLVDI